MTELDEVMVEKAARAIEPEVWARFDNATRPYIENRGASCDGEQHWYALTWAAGCRSVEDAKNWWTICDDAVATWDVHVWRQSWNKARAALTAILPDLREQRNTEILPIRDLTIAEVMAEKSRLEALWDDFRNDDEFEGGGGSPGEWMYERMNEIDTALKPLREQHYAEERGRIVAWLQKPVTWGNPAFRPFAELVRKALADAIERGEHITKEGE